MFTHRFYASSPRAVNSFLSICQSENVYIAKYVCTNYLLSTFRFLYYYIAFMQKTGPRPPD